MRKKTETWIYISAGVLILGLLLAYLLRRRYETAYLIAIMALAAVSAACHIRRALSQPGYIGRVCGISEGGSGRIAAYDYLRVMAVCGVIITHSVQIEISYRGTAGRAEDVLWVCAMAANAVYVMLSGALHYRWKEEKLSTYYLRRISAVVIPLVVYYLWYLSANYGFARGWKGASSRDILEWLFTNSMKAAPHMWLVYTILCVYLTVPFFRIALRGFPYRNLTGILLVLFVVSAATPLLNKLVVTGLTNGEMALKIPFSQWLLVSLYGYWVSLDESRRFDRVTIPLGAVSLIAMGLIAAAKPGEAVLAEWCLNSAPLPVMASTGLFALVLHFRKIFSKSNALVRSISRYSYGIILIHWYTLHFIVMPRLDVHSYDFGGLGIIPSLVLTLVISWAVCFILDNLIVFPLQLAWNTLFGLRQARSGSKGDGSGAGRPGSPHQA